MFSLSLDVFVWPSVLLVDVQYENCLAFTQNSSTATPMSLFQILCFCFLQYFHWVKCVARARCEIVLFFFDVFVNGLFE